ncbi:hypothetical protein [Sphingomicrobium clamense]|uniref:Uncharacterized protein n=1 Tax=Sphingomicrobium clamense TaxID=2851013 RepID=A0ABS6V4J1_9SPHN|nr:hypothetical protein [Sphingomicrobium sp. B8]MBW0144464.1 hypothetical protein [Sphingomicrobium sp. B8]
MSWLGSLVFGALLAFILPMATGGRDGIWRDSWAGVGTIAPFDQSPGLLFSIPLFVGSAIALRLFFSWHRN